MAKKSKPEDIAQWNFRKPGEPNNNIASTEHGSGTGTTVVTRFERTDDSDLSPMSGNSEPKTPEEIDLENTWSTAR